MKIALENPLLRKRYPAEEGSTIASVIDTGYEGFLSVPNSVFRELSLNQLYVEKRKIAFPDGTLSETRGYYATLRIPDISFKMDGFVETFPGLDEVILGAEALSEMRVILDYCARMVKVEKCR